MQEPADIGAGRKASVNFAASWNIMWAFRPHPDASEPQRAQRTAHPLSPALSPSDGEREEALHPPPSSKALRRADQPSPVRKGRTREMPPPLFFDWTDLDWVGLGLCGTGRGSLGVLER